MHWFTVGIIASLLYGLCAVLFKYLMEERFLHGSASWALIGIGIGIVICGWIGTRVWPADADQETVKAVAWALPVGVVNGLATLLIMRALQSPATNVSQLVPIYNTNTLVAFILAIVLFREFPMGMDLLRNLAGALLIVAGTILIGIR